MFLRQRPPTVQARGLARSLARSQPARRPGPEQQPGGRQLRRPGRFGTRWQALAGCTALAVACAGCGNTSAPPPAGTVVRGPIQMLVTADGVGARGDPIGITSYYQGSGHRAVAVAVLGKLSQPAELVMTWSRLTAAGPQVLFSQHLTVTSYGRAYSTAVSRGTLPFGTYQVSASVAGVTRTADWAVYAPLGKTAAAYSHTAAPLAPGPSASLPQAPAPTTFCNRVQSIIAMQGINKVELNVTGYCPKTRANKITRGTILATMGKNYGMRLIGMMKLTPDGRLTGNYRLNVCDLPKGSDLPGSVIYFTTIVYYLGTTRAFTVGYVVPANQAGPNVSISSSVPPGTPVHPGEEIFLRIRAAEPTRLGPQIGLHDIMLAGPGGQQLSSKDFTPVVTRCGRDALQYGTLRATYVVPSGAGKTITLVGLASDIPGHTSTASVSFPVIG